LSILTLEFENQLWDIGQIPAGVDEAGRGPLAGPVVAASVILSKENPIDGLNDSKALTPQKRSLLYDIISEKSVSFAVGIIENDVIDQINILQSTIKAMESSILGLTVKPDLVYIDGNRPTTLEIRQQTIVKGDTKCQSIAAASIIAKVTRDRIMEKLHEIYPQYGFLKHKGYPTKAHYEAIKMYGPSPVHRLSFKGVIIN
jgi:ribonuclease HII